MGKYLNDAKLAEIKKTKKPKDATTDTAPEQYIFTNMPLLPEMECYPNIVLQCIKQLLKRKLVIKDPSCYRGEIIEACRKYSKTEETLFRLHKKRNRITFDDNKISNFLVLLAGSIHSCLDDTTYSCYYITTVEKGYDAIIAVPQTEPDHTKAIEEKLNELNLLDKFELWGDFNQLYNFGLQFNAYVSKQKDDTFRRFIPADYEIKENKEYLKYMLEKEKQEAQDKLDMDFAEKEKRLFDEQTETQVVEPTVTDTYVAPTVDTPPIVSYDNNCSIYPSLINLINLCDSKTMLSSLGFFIANSVPQLLEKQNAYSLAIITPTEEQAYAKKVFDILHRLILNELTHPSVQFDVTQKIKYYFKKSDFSIPTIITTKEFSKEDSKKFSQALTEYYESKPNKRKDSLVIIAKKDFDCNHLHKINFNAKESPETEKAMKALKADSFFYTTIKDFLENIKSRYSTREFRFSYDYDASEQDNAELIRGEISKKIHELSNSYTLTYEDAVKYAPVVFFLEEYFIYLLQTQAITDEEYKTLSDMIVGLYSDELPEGTKNSAEKCAQPTVEELSDILLQCIFEAYKKALYPTDDTAENAFIYTKAQQDYDLICFSHDPNTPMRYIIEYLEKIGMEEKILRIKEAALTSAYGKLLKKYWKENNISHCTRNSLFGVTSNRNAIAIKYNIQNQNIEI